MTVLGQRITIKSDKYAWFEIKKCDFMGVNIVVILTAKIDDSI